jgi:hypothetical protein
MAKVNGRGIEILHPEILAVCLPETLHEVYKIAGVSRLFSAAAKAYLQTPELLQRMPPAMLGNLYIRAGRIPSPVKRYGILRRLLDAGVDADTKPDALVTEVRSFLRHYKAAYEELSLRAVPDSVASDASTSMEELLTRDMIPGRALLEELPDANLAIVDILLGAGVDVNYKKTAVLDLVCMDKKAPVVLLEKLLEAGADIHVEKDRPLRMACEHGSPEIAVMLLDAGAHVNMHQGYALIAAAARNKPDLVRELVDHGGNVHVQDDLPLIRASRSGRLSVVKVLLEAGARVHAQNDKALRVACKYGHLETVKVLLEAGADVHAEGDLPLRKACLHGHQDVVEELLICGARVFAEGGEPLKQAARGGHLHILETLMAMLIADLVPPM